MRKSSLYWVRLCLLVVVFTQLGKPADLPGTSYHDGGSRLRGRLWSSKTESNQATTRSTPFANSEALCVPVRLEVTTDAAGNRTLGSQHRSPDPDLHRNRKATLTGFRTSGIFQHSLLRFCRFASSCSRFQRSE